MTSLLEDLANLSLCIQRTNGCEHQMIRKKCLHSVLLIIERFINLDVASSTLAEIRVRVRVFALVTMTAEI